MKRLASLLSILGLSAAVYLSRLYYSTHAGTAGFKSVCNLNATFNCDLVTTTKYATLPGGIPLSSLAAGWFLALFLVSLASLVDDWKKDAVRVGFVMAAIGSVYSVALIFVMAFVLKTFCLFCLLIDLVNFGLLFIFAREVPAPRLAHLGVKKWGTYAAITAASLFLATIMIQQQNVVEGTPTAEDDAYTINEILSHPAASLPAPAGTVFLGNPNARVTILDVSDFQCPHCQRGAFLIHSLLNLYPNEIRVGFLHFPLDMSCNREMKTPLHPYACKLARGAFCAKENGKFSEYFEGVFEDQENLTDGSALATLTKLGVPEAAAKACLESDATKKALSDSIEFGIAQKVESTPTFFINGRKVEGAKPLNVWKELIARLSTETAASR